MKFSEFEPTEEVLERVSKCTTAEDVEKLAREYDVELTEEEITNILKSNSLKELNDEQLEKVAGGDGWGDIQGKHLPTNHGRHIGKYEAQGHIGERVYCVADSNTKKFCWGILEKSYEYRNTALWYTVRVHNIRIEGWNQNTDTLRGYRLNGVEESSWYHIPVGMVFEGIDSDASTLFLYNK